MSIVLKVALVLATVLMYCGSCEAKCDGKTCGQCIGESIDCAWCSATNHTEPRCQVTNKTTPYWCNEEIYNPIPTNRTKLVTISDEKITSDPRHVVQLSPQELKITIRPGQTVEFPIKYKPAKDYPLDVYYLMDFSYTMRKKIKLLKNQGNEIYKKLNEYTNNVRLGVGSFIEKAALPFVNPNIHKSYAFKHHLNLTTERADFEGKLEDLITIGTGSNYDEPEAGLDALMQVMTCKDEIGWREHARKIIVLCSDAPYHSAGDGKIAGAAKLNDMTCHLDDSGRYSLELEQDYPSVNQIRKIAKENSMIIIFNVKDKVMNEYKALISRLNIGAEVIELKEDSTIAKTIANVYTRKLGNVRMQVSVPDQSVQVKLTPDCTIEDTCTVAHAADTIIQASVTADSCLDKSKNNTIKIQPYGLSESLRINIETICQCDCEKTPEVDAAECNSNGSLVCGICECNPNHFGDKCGCVGSSMKDFDKCKAHEDDTVLCNGIERGSCNCGTCMCNPFYSGLFCQFDDRACPKVGEKLCSGRGKCTEGRCSCEGPWKGDACECPTGDSSCRAPYSDKVCSDNGICVCGECTCTKKDSKNNLYYGTYCENCHDCDEIRCKELEKYVLCVHKNDTTKEKCDEKFKSKNPFVDIVNKTEMDAPKYHLARRCAVLNDEGKTVIFRHKYENKRRHIIIQKESEEPDKANMWIAIGSAIGAILLIGLLTVIIWKVLVDLYDAREYEKFNKLLDEAGDISNINAIYRAPMASFTNPLFKRQSRMP